MTQWKVSTPIDTFEHPTTSSVIDIASTIHIADPHYYRALGSYIRSRQDEGFQVHYESISSSEDFVPKGFIEKAKYRLLEAATDAQADEFVAVEIGSSFRTQENDKLFRAEGSVNHDVTHADYIRGPSLGFHANLLRQALSARRSMIRAAKGKNRQDFEEHVFSIIQDEVMARRNDKKRRRHWGHGFIIDKRNEVALEAVDEALAEDSSSKLVLVWGIGHLAGLSAGLVGRGYERINRQEITAAFSTSIAQRDLLAQQSKIDKLRAKVVKQR